MIGSTCASRDRSETLLEKRNLYVTNVATCVTTRQVAATSSGQSGQSVQGSKAKTTDMGQAEHSASVFMEYHGISFAAVSRENVKCRRYEFRQACRKAGLTFREAEEAQPGLVHLMMKHDEPNFKW